MTSTTSILPRLVASPACLPHWPLESLLPVFQRLGFCKLELFTEWSDSRLDWRAEPDATRALCAEHGIVISSVHLPTVREPVETGVAAAVAASRCAARLGATEVIFKAASQALYETAGRMFLDALERERIPVTPLLQNHAGTVISTLADLEEVLRRLEGDPRMKVLFEVGHFQRVGTQWSEAWPSLAERVALIHLNEIRGNQSVPYGTGDVDFAGLMHHLAHDGYAGNLVVELELENQRTDTQETIRHLAAARKLLDRFHSSS